MKNGSKLKKTKNYKKLNARYRAILRKRKTYINETHSKIANKLIEESNQIYYLQL